MWLRQGAIFFAKKTSKIEEFIGPKIQDSEVMIETENLSNGDSKKIVNGIIDDFLAKLPLLEPIMEISPEIFPQVINKKVPEAKEIKATEFIEGWTENSKIQDQETEEHATSHAEATMRRRRLMSNL